MKRLLGEWAMLLAVGAVLTWIMYMVSPWPLRNYLWGLLLCYVLIGINDVHGWRYHRRIKTHVDDSWYFIRADDNIHCTCRTQRFGGLCRVHSGPFFF